MQHTDTDIDVALDDEATFPESGWARFVNIASLFAGLACLAAVPADLLDKPRLFDSVVAVFVLSLAAAGFGLVMEYRHDKRILANTDDQEV